jgi:hypothetical protein
MLNDHFIEEFKTNQVWSVTDTKPVYKPIKFARDESIRIFCDNINNESCYGRKEKEDLFYYANGRLYFNKNLVLISLLCKRTHLAIKHVK